jgi:hypothetical protein
MQSLQLCKNDFVCHKGENSEADNFKIVMSGGDITL